MKDTARISLEKVESNPGNIIHGLNVARLQGILVGNPCSWAGRRVGAFASHADISGTGTCAANGVFDFISRLAFPGEASSNSKPSDTRPLVDVLDKWPRLILERRGYRDNYPKTRGEGCLSASLILLPIVRWT